MLVSGRFFFFAALGALAVGLAGPAAAQFNPLSGIVGAIEAAAEDRSSSDIAADLKIKTAVVAALTDKLGKEGALLGVDVYEQDIMLTGNVPKAEIKAQAGKIAAAAVDARKVLNEVLLDADIVVADKGKSANLVDDTVIEAKLKALYVEGKGINVTNWRWRSIKGRVFLFGRALSKDEHAKAAAIAKSVSGVVSVTNRAKIRPKA